MNSGRSVSRSQRVRTQIGEVLLHLRHVQSAVAVAVAALRRQNCELDEDVANVLQHSVTDRLQDQIEKLEIVVRSGTSPGRSRQSH